MLEVILTKDVDNLGRAGELVRVKPGYGRNFLLPQGLALVATRGNIAQLEHHKRTIAREQAKIRADHEQKAKQLDKASVSIARQVGQDEKLFGSVTTKDIAEALAAQNVEIERKLIQLDEPIKSVGTHEVFVRFSADVRVPLKVRVVGLKK
jgi:large subunit ribosomal protein L9